MALYAELDANKKVLRVVVCDNIAWLQQRLGGTWVETTDADATKQYAGPGMYDGENIAPRRFIPEWVQPFGAGDPTLPMKGDWRWHEGRAWRNLVDNNPHAPGVSGWREMLVEFPDYVQPAGAHDAYQQGEKVTESGGRYIAKRSGVVYPPSVDPSAWDWVGGEPPTSPEPDEWQTWKPWDGNNANLHQVGSKVTHNGQRWIANVGNNHWEPGVFGWVQA